MGIEPMSKAWEAFVLPLNYTRVIEFHCIQFMANDKMIALTINGEPRHFDERLNVAQLLEKLELKGRRLALEKNGEIVPHSCFNDEILRDGDQLEIVVAVGGG